MLYAKVVLGLPVEGPFDYSVPKELEKLIKAGSRVWVNWRNQKKLAYVVKLAKKTSIKKVKALTSVIDRSPILDKDMLILTRQLSDYYCCSWGEAIETALPEGLRKGKSLPVTAEENVKILTNNQLSADATIPEEEDLLVHDPEGLRRWDIYISRIKQTLRQDKSAIILFPDRNAVLKAKDIINARVNCAISVLERKAPGALQEWARIKSGKTDVVIGSRSSIFAPLDNLGLVIIDEEQDYAYKQDQVPHYHPREIAFMRKKLEKAKVILGSTSVSLESFYLAKKKQIKYLRLERTKINPEVKIINIMGIAPSERKRGVIISRYLQDAIAFSLSENSKILLFLNRKGFATVASCVSCGANLKCPRCSINLVFHFKGNVLSCHYCNFRMQPPLLCPHCNAGYIKYSGTGTEKIESELSRIFPQARIRQVDGQGDIDISSADIFVSTQSIIRDALYNFDLIGVLGIDNSLNRADLRASEKTFQILSGLSRLTDKRIIIQTNLARHHCFQALLNRDADIFYNQELIQRRQLKFPPYQHIGLVKIRGSQAARVDAAADRIFLQLSEANKDRGIKIVSVNRAQPAQLRGNFYWQILIRATSPVRLTKFLKMHLKSVSHSGIIVTVDIDPL